MLLIYEFLSPYDQREKRERYCVELINDGDGFKKAAQKQ